MALDKGVLLGMRLRFLSCRPAIARAPVITRPPMLSAASLVASTSLAASSSGLPPPPGLRPPLPLNHDCSRRSSSVVPAGSDTTVTVRKPSSYAEASCRMAATSPHELRVAEPTVQSDVAGRLERCLKCAKQAVAPSQSVLGSHFSVVYAC